MTPYQAPGPGGLFTTADRADLQRELVHIAQDDPDVTAAALVGSAARQTTDAWSDVDLALRLAPDRDPLTTADRWSERLGRQHEIADQLDIWSGGALYRVFLLGSSLQVDLSFWPNELFASTGEAFTLLFGEANPTHEPTEPRTDEIVGWAWLYALHARSAIARGRLWQATQMLDGLRDRIITLACLRHGLAGHQGRGTDQLPEEVRAALAATLVGQPVRDVLTVAFGAAITVLLAEVVHVDPARADRLRPPLTRLVESAG